MDSVINFDTGEHNEFVVEFKGGKRDWVDPVSEATQDNEYIYIVGGNGYMYQFNKLYVQKWVIRPYSESTTYDPI